MKPNLLYIFADQLNGFSLGCLGHPDARTPNLDALAARGTVLQNACSSAPVCTPARITMWTGQYAGNLGTLTNDAQIPDGVPTLADTFRNAGYLTSYVGKWHIGGAGNVPVEEGLRGGFEAFAGFQCYNEFHKNVCFFDEQNQVIDYSGHHRTDATFDLAIERLRTAATDGRPFILCVSEQAPHYPCQPTEEFLAPFSGRQMSLHPNTVVTTEPYTPTYSPPSPRKEDDPTFQAYGGDMQEYLRHYHAAVSQLDNGVGRIVAELDRLGIAEHTIIIFSSDHGDMQGSHGRINKCVPYEESLRIPFIAAGPGIVRGAIRQAPIGTVDFLPTFADLCGIAGADAATGNSFAAILGGSNNEVETAVFSEDQSGWAMIRTKQWKLISDIHIQIPSQLFSLENDPYEMDNLLGKAETLSIQNTLLASLRLWRKDNPLL